jgi:C_GCAxxG_C_C family probable redox protein
MTDEDTLLSILPLAQRGYCCSQIILLLGLEAQGETNPALVRAVSGLCHGIGGGGHTCGALTGAACLLGLYAGKGGENDQEDQSLPLMLETLAQWFSQYTTGFGGTGCTDIMGESATQPDPNICGRLIADTVDQALAILVDNGFDPGVSPDAP